MTAPILFLIFNRPDKTKAVFETIRAARPARLYVAADGPRADRADEAELCAQTRAVVDTVDWPCDVHTLFRDENLGCRQAVAQAITWFFDHEPEGIIIEDDIQADPSFFDFATQMLERYRDDARVMSVTACNMQPDSKEYSASYYFSAFIHVWGWATWRRAWDQYDRELADLDSPEAQAAIEAMCPAPGAAEYWLRQLRNVRDGVVDTWDYSWVYTQWKARGLTVTPAVNLMRNIGFDSSATHTTRADQWEASLRADKLPMPLTHPGDIVQDIAADTHVARNVFRVKPTSWRRKLKRKLGLVRN